MGNERIKVEGVVCDFDGTLKDDGPLDSRIPRYVETTKNFVLATARTLSSVMRGGAPTALQNLAMIPGISISYGNGSLVQEGGIDEKGTRYIETPLTERGFTLIREVLPDLQPNYIIVQAGVDVYGWFRKGSRESFERHYKYGDLSAEKIYFSGDISSMGLSLDKEDIRKFAERVRTKGNEHVDCMSFLDGMGKKAPSKVVLCHCEGDLNEVEARLKTGDVYYVRGGENNVSFTGTNKLRSLKVLAARRDIPERNILFAGNDFNDREPLLCPELGVRVFVGSLPGFLEIYKPFMLVDGSIRLKNTDKEANSFNQLYKKYLNSLRADEISRRELRSKLFSSLKHITDFDYFKSALKDLRENLRIKIPEEFLFFGPKNIADTDIAYIRMRVKEYEESDSLELFIVNSPKTLIDLLYFIRQEGNKLPDTTIIITELPLSSSELNSGSVVRDMQSPLRRRGYILDSYYSDVTIE